MEATNTFNSVAILPLAISLVTIFGILVHDTQVANATELLVDHQGVVNESTYFPRVAQHIHMDSGVFIGAAFSAKTATPTAQPRNNDDKKYISQKRFLSNTAGSDYSLPRIPTI